MSTTTMKSIITIALLLSAIFSYGQKTKTKPCSRCWSYADNLTAIDSMRLWIDKVDHMYENLANQSIRLNRLCDQIDEMNFKMVLLFKIVQKQDTITGLLSARILALESRPYFSIDSSGRLWGGPINTFVTGTAVLDSAIKRKP